MKSHRSNNLILKLNRLREELRVLNKPESRDAMLKDLDELIAALNDLRTGLANSSVGRRGADIQQPLDQVIEFLEFAKSNEVLTMLLSSSRKRATVKPKRQPIEITSNLTNQQIRALLEKDLSKAELKAIASQRAISVVKSTNKEIKRDILKNLERQEGYASLAIS